MQELSRALNKAMKQSGIDRAVRQNRALFVWEEVVGKTVAKNCSAEEVSHGTIVVKAATPVWRNELALKKKEIVDNLNTTLGENLIKDMRII